MGKKLLFVFFILSLLPNFGLAFDANPGIYRNSLVGTVAVVLNVVLDILWLVAVAFAIIMFIVAGFKFFTSQGDPVKVRQAGMSLVWGVAGVVVVLFAWSIIKIVRNQFGV